MGNHDVNLKEFENDVRGKPFGSLILHHIDRNRKSFFTPNSKLVSFFTDSINGTIQLLPKKASLLVEGFIDNWNFLVKQSQYWQGDCADNFLLIIKDAKKLLAENSIPFNDNTLFDMFNIIVLNYAYNAVCEKNMEKFIRNSIQ